MVARLIIEVLLGLGLIIALLVASYRYASARQAVAAPTPTPELDVSRTPSMWFTDSRSVGEAQTEICIVRVETKTGVVRERRVLRRLDNDDPQYKDQLDKAMDDAYEAARVANLNLFRR